MQRILWSVEGKVGFMKVCFRVESVALLPLTRSSVYDVHANKNGLYFACFCEWPCEQRVMMEDF